MLKRVATILLLLAGPAGATPGTVAQYSTINAVEATGGDLGSPVPNAVVISGALNVNDGGGGTFNYFSGSCTSDHGVIIKEKVHSYCYRRQFNGPVHLLWYGVNSGTTGSDVHTAIGSAFDRAGNGTGESHSNAVTTDGIVNLQITQELDIPADTSFDCGATPDSQRSLGDFRTVPGSLMVTPPGLIKQKAANTSLHHCTIIAAGLYAGGALPTTVQEELTMLGRFPSNGTAVMCKEMGCNDHDLLILGFDVGYELVGAPNSTLNNVLVDADVCFWVHQTGGASNWGPTNCHTYLTENLEVDDTRDVEGGVGSDSNTVWWTITAVSAHTDGSCRVTLAPDAGHLFAEDTIWVSGLATEGCNGRWKIASISASDVVLSGSFYNGTSVAGTMSAPSKQANVDSTANIAPGQVVTSSLLPVGTTVVAVYKGTKSVLMSNAATSTGATVFTFTNHHSPPTGACHGASVGGGPCLWLSAQGRFLYDTTAGAAGLLSGGSTGYFIGGPAVGDEHPDEVTGFASFAAFSYAHDIEYHIEDGDNIGFSMAGSDNDGAMNDPTTINVLVDGDDQNVEFLGRKAGKDGAALVVNNTNDVGCVNYESTNAKATIPTQLSFEFDDGCVVMSGVRGMAPGIGLISTHDEPVFLTNNFAPNVQIYYADQYARAATQATANRFLNGSDVNIDLALAKGATGASAPGAGFCKLEWVQGTGTAGKLVAYCGTSTTPQTVVNNVGSGF